MSQQSVCRFLNRKSSKGKWLSSKQIKKGLRTDSLSITTNLKSLHKQGAVHRKQLKTDDSSGFFYYVYQIK